jgi:PAS domain S-box-containing protein
MKEYKLEFSQIKEILKGNPQGMSVTEIAGAINKNKHSVGRYLDILRAAGEVEVRNYGMAKVFSLSQRMPISSILKNSSELVMVLDKDLRVIQINDLFLKYLHKSQEEVIGKNITYIPLAGIAAHEMIEEIAQAIQDHASVIDISTGSGGNKHFFKARIIQTLLEDESSGFTVILIDVTEQKRAEIALHLSEARYRAVVEGQSELICRFTPDGTHVFVNEAYCRYFNKSRGEIVGRPFISTVPEEDREVVRQHFASLSQENPISTIEHRIILPDGTIRWQQWTDRAIFNDRGDIVEYQSVGRDITDRKQAEEALRTSEEKYRELVQNANSVILKMDMEGNITFFNEFAEKFFGYSKEEVLGRNVLGTIVPPADTSGKDLRDLIRSICRHPDQYTINENENMTRDGRRVWMRWTNRVNYDETGDPSGIFSVGVDITEHRRMEEQLAASERKFRELAELLPLPVFEADESCMLTYGNQQAFHSFGYIPEDFTQGASLLEMLVPEDRERAFRNIQGILTEAHRTREEYTAQRKDGTTFPITEYSSPIIEGNRIVGLRGIVIDLTEHNQARQALKEERDFNSAVLNTVDALIVVLDPEGRIVRFNRACEELTGYTFEEVRGRPFWDIFLVPEEVERVRSTFNDLLINTAHRHARNYWVSKNGAKHLIDWSSSALPGDHGSITHVIGTGIDITGQIEMEENLKICQNHLAGIRERLPVNPLSEPTNNYQKR